MKVYFLADTHLGMKGDNEIWLKECYEYYIKSLIPYLKKNVQPDDILIHCGDVFDNRSNIGIQTINVAITLFEKFSEIFNDIRIIVGNHDMMRKHDTKMTSVNILKYIPNVKIYYKPCVETIADKSVLFVPWMENINEQKSLLQKYTVDYVFGHLEIGGAVINNKGVTMSVDKSISKSEFKKAEVFAGHIHIRQDIKNVHYVGSPYHKDRGDIGNTKGITVLDMDSGEREFVENNFSPIFIEESIYNILDNTIEELKEKWKHNIIDLLVDTNDITKCDFESLREELINIVMEFNIKTIGDLKTSSVNIDTPTEIKTSEEYLNDYLEHKDLTDTNKRLVKELFIRIKNKL